MSVSFSGGTIDSSGDFIAGDVPGKYSFEVFAGTISAAAEISISGQDTHTQEIAEEAPLSQIIKEIRILPSVVTLNPGEKQKFEFQGINVDGKIISPEISIQFSGGQFSGDGTFTAGTKPGKYKIVASTNSGHKAEAEIYIRGDVKEIENSSTTTNTNAKPKLHEIILTPKRIRVHPHESFQFEFNAVDQNGKRVATSLSWSYQGGRMNADGLFTPGYGYGQHYVTLEGDNGISATSIVAIIPKDEYVPTIWLEIFPRQVTLNKGESCYFNYKVTNEYGQFVDSSKLTWQFMGGTWNPETKMYTAGNEAGDYYLRAKYQNSEYVTARAYVIIK